MALRILSGAPGIRVAVTRRVNPRVVVAEVLGEFANIHPVTQQGAGEVVPELVEAVLAARRDPLPPQAPDATRAVEIVAPDRGLARLGEHQS